MDLRGPSKSPAYSGEGHINSTIEVDAASQEHEINPMLRGGANSDSEINKSEPYNNAAEYRPRKFDFVWKWKWELLSLVGTTMSLVAIVIVLNHYDGKPSPKWPYEITLNTLISIFSTLLKALMMMAVAECISQLKWIWFKHPRSLTDLTVFENASRGPWGSTQLLFTLKFHHLAVIGALVTIVTVAVDPFVQQAVRFYSCPYVETNSIASIPIAKSYAPKQDMLATVEVAMVAAIYNGLLNRDFNGSSVTSKCPTGNCTFPIKYTTFGVCSSCANLAYDISNEFVNGTYNGSFHDPVTFDNTIAPVSRMILNSTLPGPNDPQSPSNWQSLSMVQPPIDSAVSQPLALLVAPTIQLPNFTFFPQSAPYEDKGYYLSGFTSIAYTTSPNCTTDWMDGGERHPKTDCVVPSKLPGAKEKVPTCQSSPMDLTGPCVSIDDFDSITASACGLSFCGKTYEGVVHNGVFNETLVSESNATAIAWDNIGHRGSQPANNVTSPDYLLSPCWYNNTEYKDVYEYLGFNTTQMLWGYSAATTASEDYSASNETLAFPGSPLNLTYMQTMVSSDPRKKAVMDACTINSTRMAYENLETYLYDFLNGNATGQAMSLGGSDGRINPGKNWATYINRYSSEWLDPMFASGQATHATTEALFARLAASMTNHMRTSDPNGMTVLGQVNGTQTCVRVEWAWLALPAVLVLATCLLLISTIFKTATQANTNIWKSSPLAYLFHGLTEQGRADVRGGLITVDEMDSVAKGKDVLLTETGEGWRFVSEPKGTMRS